MSDQNQEIKKVGEGGSPPEGKEPAFDKAALRKRLNENLMGVKPEEPTKKEPVAETEEVIKDEPVVDEEPAKKEVIKDEPDKKKDDEVDDDDLDLDLDTDEFEEEDDDTIENDEEEEDDDLNKNIVALRKKHEDLKNDYDAQEEKLTETLNRLKEKEEELEKYTLTRIDPKSHPDFTKKSESTANAIYSKLVRLKGVPDAAEKLGDQWGNILTDVDQYENTPRAEKSAALSQLRLSIAKKLDLVGSDSTELDPSIDDEAIDSADRVIDLFEQHSGDYRELANIYKNIQSKAVDKSLEIGHQEYQQNTMIVRESLAMIDSMSEKDIEEDPTSLQALAAKKIMSSPDLKAKSAKIDKLLIEMAYGAEALSQEELDRHSKSGKDMDEFHNARNRRVKEFREKRLPEIKSLMILLPQIKKILPEFFEKEAKEMKKKTQKQVVRGVTDKQPKKQPDKKEEMLTKDDLREKMRKNLIR